MKYTQIFKQQEVNLFIPQLIYSILPELFLQHNLSSEISKIHYYYLLINTIRYQSLIKLWDNVKQSFNIKIQFANLNSRFLLNLLGKHYKSYVNNLLKMGLLDGDGEYRRGKKSLGYKISDSFYNISNYQDLHSVIICNKIINKRLTKIKQQVIFNKLQKRKEQSILFNNPDNLIIKNHIQKFFSNYNYQDALSYINSNLKGNSHKKAIQYLDKIGDVREGDVDLKISKYGRYFSIVTNAKKELLKFYNSENFNSRLIELDLTSAQPVLFTSFYKIYNIPDSQKTINKQTYRWSNDAKQIYSIIQKLYNQYYSKNYSRNRIKKKLITFLNQKNCYMLKSDLFPILKRYYPSALKLLLAIKKDNHKNFAKLLQKKESDIFIQQILIPFSKNHFIISKHDSLIIQLKDYNKLMQMIYKVFSSNKLYDYNFKIIDLKTGKLIDSTQIQELIFSDCFSNGEARWEGDVKQSNNNNTMDLQTMLNELNISYSYSLQQSII